MVYCGKPSPSCGRCRIRRLRCDLSKPSCTQCVRANCKCPGYRDMLALRFRDQSVEVMQKSRRPRDEKEVSNQEHSSTNKDFSAAPLALLPIAQPSTALAQGFIYSHFVLNSMDGPLGPLGFIDAVPASENEPILAAVNAVGLAALSNIHKHPTFMRAALKEYVSALAATQSALDDQDSLKKDSTLASVILLGVFEVMSCQGTFLIDRWLHHFEGAKKLVELRGPEQLKRPAGLQLFSRFREHIVLSDIIQKRPTSPWFMQLCKEAVARRNLDDQGLDCFFDIFLQVSDLYAAITKGEFDNNREEAVSMLLSLDEELILWSRNLPPNWRYTVVGVSHTRFNDWALQSGNDCEYHTYPNIDIASRWNNFRTIRILIHETLLYLCDQISSQKTGQKQRDKLEVGDISIKSLNTLKQLSNDICATVPYHLGFIPTKEAVEQSAQVGHVRFAGGFFLIWPLFMAANTVETPPSLREWIICCLHNIGLCTGINQALLMAQLLCNGPPFAAMSTSAASAKEPAAWAKLSYVSVAD